MPVSDEMRASAREFLEPGEEIRYIFPAELRHSFMPCVVFVVSDRAITILSTGFWSREHAKGVYGRFRRDRAFGPVETGITPAFFFNKVLYEVDDEYVAVINAADAELEQGSPPDPFPDL